jgi:hypothetical protein
MAENWIDFALYVAAASVALLCLFEGTRRIGAYGAHRAGVLMFVASAAACATAGGFAYQKYGTLNAAVGTVQRKAPATQTAAVFTKVPSPERKELLSQAVAKRRFKESGAPGPYIDRNGETKTFVPTLDDLKAREQVVAYYAQADFAARSSLAEAMVWLIAAIVAVLLGLVMALAKPPAPKSSEEDALAAEPPLHG